MSHSNEKRKNKRKKKKNKSFSIFGDHPYKLPNKKKWLLTDGFLKDFLSHLDTYIDEREHNFPVQQTPKEERSYMNTYGFLESTFAFSDSLLYASKLHNVEKGIYQYAIMLPWYDFDHFCSQLNSLLMDRGFFPFEHESDSYSDELEIPDEVLFKDYITSGKARINTIKTQYNGYFVCRKEVEFLQ